MASIVYSAPADNSSNCELLEIIGQPCYTSELRYRSDFTTNRKRRGVLHSTTNSNYNFPTIRIPQSYLNATEAYYICICLVTVEHEPTKCRYIHPYELEDIANQGYHDRYHNTIWYPVEIEDICGVKSFRNLRIVKRKADDLKNYGNFRVFNSPNNQSSPQRSLAKDTIKEFNLEKSQLVFGFGQKLTQNNDTVWVVYHSTTIFSDELTEQGARESESGASFSESGSVCSTVRKSFDCRLKKYAPKYGYADGNDEMLIYCTTKIEPKKYGELQVRFEYLGPADTWIAPVKKVEVTDRLASFRTPTFPFPIDYPTSVNIILRQKARILATLTFQYIPSIQLKADSLRSSNSFSENNPHNDQTTIVYNELVESDSDGHTYELQYDRQAKYPRLSISQNVGGGQQDDTLLQ